jgi:hypothetical protein
MQVNSAQDYLTAQKRRIVAATPLQSRHNYVYLSAVANKATQYDKVPYPQTLSLAARSTPGPAYVTAGVRPTVNSCCVVAGSLI